jgi:hypothetical protein
MRGRAFFAMMSVLLAATPSNALDTTEADIIGLRLGMPEAEIIVALRRQGFAVAHDHGALTTYTRDGQLTVDLNPNRAAQRIRYAFAGNGVGESGKLLAAILDRFGPPDQATPMVWCQALGRNGICPESAASLTFLPDKLILLLRAGTEHP